MQTRHKNNITFTGPLRRLRKSSHQTAAGFGHNVPKRNGVVLLMYMSALGVLIGFCSLAVDFGHLVTTQTEVRNVADAAAHAAAQQLTNNGTQAQQIAAARAAAEQVAALNQVNGAPVTLADGDILIGNWDTTQTPNFSTSRSPLNAAQVTVHFDAAGGNAFTLMFAQAIGMSSISISKTIVATNTNLMSPYGFAGLDSVSFGSVGVLASIQGDIVSNGTVSIGNPLGLGVTVTGKALSATGSVTHGALACVQGYAGSLSTALTYPIPVAPTTNDNAQIASYLDSGQNFNGIVATDIPAGTYVVNDLSLLANVAVNLHGPTTFYVSGTFSMAATINLLGSCNTDPSNLNIIVLNGGQVDFLANLLTPVAMNIYAPQVPITIAVGVNQYTGSIIGKSLNVAVPVLSSFVEVKPTQATAMTALVQ
jgi:Flp pilus assembly protein TadG